MARLSNLDIRTSTIESRLTCFAKYDSLNMSRQLCHDNYASRITSRQLRLGTNVAQLRLHPYASNFFLATSPRLPHLALRIFSMSSQQTNTSTITSRQLRLDNYVSTIDNYVSISPLLLLSVKLRNILAPRGAWLRQKSCQELSCSRSAGFEEVSFV